MLFASGGLAAAAALPQPPAVESNPWFDKQEKHHVITMFAITESCADHFVWKWGGGGLHSPQPPHCFQAIRAYKEKGSIMVVRIGGAAPPQPLSAL